MWTNGQGSNAFMNKTPEFLKKETDKVIEMIFNSLRLELVQKLEEINVQKNFHPNSVKLPHCDILSDPECRYFPNHRLHGKKIKTRFSGGHFHN